MSQNPKFLAIDGLCAWYGESQALHGVSLAMDEGEVVTLLGRNGAGKSTTMKSIMGLIRRRSGRIDVRGAACINETPERIARLGVALCPEERAIYASLTVHENLVLPPVLSGGGMSLDEIYRLFPNLLERRANSGARLSGGEQQMLAIARILRTGAKLLLLDEPTEGLAPVIIDQIEAVINILRDRGFTILLVEQNARFASRVASRHFIIEQGRIIDEVLESEMAKESARIEAYLAV